MPSLAAKPERIASSEAADPVKQIVNMLEKRIRNLEKRKMKLDNYRLDVKNGKELNEDQKIAVSKYDQVESLLEFSRELSKSMNSVVLESARQQKKMAKKEQLERQQHEIQRLQEAYMYCHILSSLQNEDIRNDFLKGENGAVLLTSEQLSQLDQLYKLIGPGLPAEQADLSNHFHTLAENHIFLVEGKNKEIVGTTYKVLKDLVLSIKECGYFSRPSGPVEEDGTSSEDTPEDEISIKNDQKDDIASNDVELPQCDEQNSEDNSPAVSVPPEEITCNEITQPSNAPIQDVLDSESAFNFLQESQIDLGDPHLDPAVVAVHQMAPPPPPTPVNFTGNSYTASPLIEDKPINGSEICNIANQPPPVNHIPSMPSTVSRTTAPPALSAIQLSSQQEFDPSHPIPTQTFTNQSFAVMQNMIMPQGYVPVTMHHGPMPPHAIAPIAVVPGLSTPVTTGASVVPLPVPMAPVSIPPPVNTNDEAEPKHNEIEDEKPSEENDPAGENELNSSHNPIEKNGENGYAPSYRGGYRRGRGRGNNGYFRGRPNYNGRGGFQNHYYQDRNGYNGNYRRGNNRGPRGGNGNNRGRGNYRTQGSSAQQQQQAQ